MVNLDAVYDYIDEHYEKHLAVTQDFVRQPSSLEGMRLFEKSAASFVQHFAST